LSWAVGGHQRAIGGIDWIKHLPPAGTADLDLAAFDQFSGADGGIGVGDGSWRTGLRWKSRDGLRRGPPKCARVLAFLEASVWGRSNDWLRPRPGGRLDQANQQAGQVLLVDAGFPRCARQARSAGAAATRWRCRQTAACRYWGNLVGRCRDQPDSFSDMLKSPSRKASPCAAAKSSRLPGAD